MFAGVFNHCVCRWHKLACFQDVGFIFFLSMLPSIQYLLGARDSRTDMLFCRWLDLSYNQIRVIQGLEECRQLKRLFLQNNKITKIENLQHFPDLEMLELGANRIRVFVTGLVVVLFIRGFMLLNYYKL